jgi:DNA-binding MarR family transcriptional regulator
MSDSRSLTRELSRSWRELGSVLQGRRLLTSLGGGRGSRLTPTKLRALDLLAESGGLRTGELAARMAVDDTTATRLADRLEQSGVARRRREPNDGRASVVVLTVEGERLVAALGRRREQFFREVLAALDPDEREELVRLTAKATEALRARSEERVAR